jgi:hypothetical protein
MPPVIPVHVAIRSRLKDSVDHALKLNDKLECVIAVKSSSGSGGGFHGKIDHSQPPWCASVAHAIMDLHAQSRDAEACLRLSLRLPKRDRGGSGANTRKALESVLRLCQGAHDDMVISNTRWLEGWSRKASIALGDTEIPRRLPRIEGQKEPACPFCENHTLRMLPLKGIIKCLNKDCKDEEGRKPKANLKYSEFTRQLELIWQDNIIGLP